MQPNNEIPQQQGSNLYPPSPYTTPQLAPSSMLQPPTESYGKQKAPVGLIIALVIVALLFITSTVLAVMFYMQMQDYKLNSDKKSAAAVALAMEKQKKDLDQQYAEQSKEPLTSYTSPAELGSVAIYYPKTWSAYVDEKGSQTPLDAYFHPSYVPSASGSNSDTFNYALRAQILQTTYRQATDSYNQYIKKGEATATPLTGLPGGAIGLRIDGKIDSNSNGSVVIIPVRDKVLKIWTEGDVYKNDFNNFILKNLKFNP